MARTPEGPWRRSDRPGWWCKINGKKHRLDVDDKASKTTARREWLKLIDEKPSPVRTAGATVKTILQAYLADSNNKPEACRQVGHFAASFIDAVGDLPPSEIIPNHVTFWTSSKATWGNTNKRNAVGAMKAMFNWSKREGLISTNPISDARKPPKVKRTFAFDGAQIMLAITAANKYFAPFVAALAATGARPSEIARAKKEDASQDGKMIYLPTGKQGARSIYFPIAMEGWLKSVRESARAGGPLFPNRLGGHFNPGSWTDAWKRTRRAAGLPKEGTCYTFRHTWITRLVSVGVPLAIIAKAAGTSIQMISDHYSHLQPRDVESWRHAF